MVDPVTLGPVRTLPQAPRPSTTKASAQGSATPAPTPSAMANLPKLVSLAGQLAEQGPPIDYAKIAQVRQAIAQGEYTVDLESIAHSIVGYYRTGK